MFGAVIYITMYSDSWKFLAGAGLLTLFFVVKSGQNLSFWLKYPLSVKGWMDNWGNLSTYFEYSPDIRRAIYTTNAIEAMHRQIRKITKTKGAFTSDQALMKLVYLTIKDI